MMQPSRTRPSPKKIFSRVDPTHHGSSWCCRGQTDLEERQTMRFMIIRKADSETEGEDKPTEALLTAMMAYNEEMIRAGVMIGGEGLHPSRKGARVEFRRGKPTVIDGPFTESKELVAGYTLIQVKSREEAIEWAKRWPAEDAHG